MEFRLWFVRGGDGGRRFLCTVKSFLLLNGISFVVRGGGGGVVVVVVVFLYLLYSTVQYYSTETF